MTPKELHKLLIYDADSGLFYWRPRHDTRSFTRWAGKQAGTYNADGYISLRFAGGRSISGAKAAWLMHYGRKPRGKLRFINGDPRDCRIANLTDVW